jgi:hypothetical protein
MKTTMTLEKQILEKIRARGLRPTPKSFFKARDLALWVVLGAFVAALSIGFGMIIFMIKGADLALFETLGLSASEKLLYSVPFFWIAATLAIGAVVYINYRTTKKGYKTSIGKFSLIALIIAIILGSAVYASNITNYIDRAASHLPIYNAVVPLNTNSWFDPEHGLLSGVVRNRESNSDFYLSDGRGTLWHVTGTFISMPRGFEFHSDDRIKIIGTKISEDEFRAIEIRPWEEKKERVTAGEADAI